MRFNCFQCTNVPSATNSIRCMCVCSNLKRCTHTHTLCRVMLEYLSVWRHAIALWRDQNLHKWWLGGFFFLFLFMTLLRLELDFKLSSHNNKKKCHLSLFEMFIVCLKLQTANYLLKKNCEMSFYKERQCHWLTVLNVHSYTFQFNSIQFNAM